VTEYRSKILSVVLALVLLLVTIAYVYQGVELKVLRVTQTEALLTVQRQTQLIVVLSQKLAKESFRNFGSEQELRTWTTNWQLTKMPVVVEFLNTAITLRGQKYSIYQDCDDFAEAMQRDALKDSYLMSVALIDGEGMIYGTRVSDFPNHTGIVAIAGNTFWYIEPQTGTMTVIIGRD